MKHALLQYCKEGALAGSSLPESWCRVCRSCSWHDFVKDDDLRNKHHHIIAQLEYILIKIYDLRTIADIAQRSLNLSKTIKGTNQCRIFFKPVLIFILRTKCNIGVL